LFRYGLRIALGRIQNGDNDDDDNGFIPDGRGSQTRVALAGMCENGATSLPKIFIGGKCIGGAGGFSALTDLVEKDELQVRKLNVTLQYMSPLQI